MYFWIGIATTANASAAAGQDAAAEDDHDHKCTAHLKQTDLIARCVEYQFTGVSHDLLHFARRMEEKAQEEEKDDTEKYFCATTIYTFCCGTGDSS